MSVCWTLKGWMQRRREGPGCSRLSYLLPTAGATPSVSSGELERGPRGRDGVCHTQSHVPTPGTSVDPFGLDVGVPSWPEKGKQLSFRMTPDTQKSHWQVGCLYQIIWQLRVPEVRTRGTRDLFLKERDPSAETCGSHHPCWLETFWLHWDHPPS